MREEFCSFQIKVSQKGGLPMAVNIKELPRELQRKIKKKARVRMGQDEVKRHALAVAALLVDQRNLTTSEARRVFTKAIALLR
jgi:hypothetical protein